MSISKKDVEHIAELARIELTEGEKAKFEKNLSDILTFVEQLNEADTERVEPMTGGTDMVNSVRGDDQAEKELEGKSEKLLVQVPNTKDRWLKVKAIFE